MFLIIGYSACAVWNLASHVAGGDYSADTALWPHPHRYCHTFTSTAKTHLDLHIHKVLHTYTRFPCTPPHRSVYHQIVPHPYSYTRIRTVIPALLPLHLPRLYCHTHTGAVTSIFELPHHYYHNLRHTVTPISMIPHSYLYSQTWTYVAITTLVLL
jgi:hypothetical protein